MVLSLAFILAFIGSAVALLIGILIFSEVAEAMALTLPELQVFIPATPEVEGLWFIREHCANNNCVNFNPSSEYRFESTSQSVGGFDGVVRLRGAGGTGAIGTGAYMFKVFDVAQIDGKLITFEQSRQVLNSNEPQIVVFDGELDGNKFGIFPLDCGVDCFPDQRGILKSGSGGVITIISPNTPNSNFGIFNHTGSVNLSSFDSPTGKVTFGVHQPENSPAVFMGSYTYQITIADHGTYRFKSDPNDPAWNGSTVTCLGNPNTSSCTTATVGLKEETTWSATSRPPPNDPVFNSPDTINANKTFNNALNIGFTVVGILPVALFFALFAIFSGRTE